MLISRYEYGTPWAKRLWSSRSHSAKRAARAVQVRPLVEGLEDRIVLSFLPPVSYGAGASAGGVTVGKFNADSIPDLAVVDTTTGTVNVLLGGPGNTFLPGTAYPSATGAFDVAKGDFNGDGKTDLAIAGFSGVSLLLGNGDGTFRAPTTSTTAPGSHSIVVGDFNGDGKLDAATMNSTSATVLLGKGDGTFLPHIDAPIPGNSTNAVVGDFNRDGKLDLATSNTASVGTITILSGRGDGTFNPPTSQYAFSAPVSLSAGDLDHDGYDDFVVANSYAASSMSYIHNNGDGTYAAPVTYNIAETGYEIEAGDFNGDGNVDFAVRGSSLYMMHLGRGDGTFYPEASFATPTGRFEMGSKGDLNGDGAVDFVYPSTTGVTVVMNAADDRANLAGAVGFKVVMPTTTTAGSPLNVSVSAVDATGKVVPGFRGTVYLTTNDPAGSPGLAYTFTAADAGVHSFNGSIHFSTPGLLSATIAAPFMTSTTKSVTVTGAVTHFSMTNPVSSAAGASYSVTVKALDAVNAVGVGYTSTIHFSSTDTQAGLPADYTFTAADAGIHTFSVTLRSSGLIFVGVAEAGGTASGGSTVSVTSGAAKSFTLAASGGAIGVSRPVTMVATDLYGNVATSYHGTVHVTSSDPLAVLPSDTALANGVAVVNVTLLTVGTQTITATDPAAALTGTISSNATPPVAKLLSITGPATATAGTAGTFVVTVKDTIGQVATGYTGTVYFSSSDIQAGLPSSYTFTAADAGKHTFLATFRTSRNQSLSVADSTGSLTGGQLGVVVTPAKFVGYRLSVPLGTDSKGHMLVTAGDLIPLTVKAVDSYGNAIVGYRGKVHFTSTDTQAGLLADWTFTAADGGSHTFNVALKTATPNATVWSISVVDSLTPSTLATMTNFEVTNAAAAKFLLTGPSNATVGTAVSLKLTVLDAYGNGVKNYFGTVHFSNTAGNAGLPADYTFTALDAGVHTFVFTPTILVDQTIAVVDTRMPTLTASTLLKVKASGGGGGGSGGGGGGGGRG